VKVAEPGRKARHSVHECWDSSSAAHRHFFQGRDHHRDLKTDEIVARAQEQAALEALGPVTPGSVDDFQRARCATETERRKRDRTLRLSRERQPIQGAKQLIEQRQEGKDKDKKKKDSGTPGLRNRSDHSECTREFAGPVWAVLRGRPSFEESASSLRGGHGVTMLVLTSQYVKNQLLRALRSFGSFAFNVSLFLERIPFSQSSQRTGKARASGGF